MSGVAPRMMPPVTLRVEAQTCGWWAGVGAGAGVDAPQQRDGGLAQAGTRPGWHTPLTAAERQGKAAATTGQHGTPAAAHLGLDGQGVDNGEQGSGLGVGGGTEELEGQLVAGHRVNGQHHVAATGRGGGRTRGGVGGWGWGRGGGGGGVCVCVWCVGGWVGGGVGGWGAGGGGFWGGDNGKGLERRRQADLQAVCTTCGRLQQRQTAAGKRAGSRPAGRLTSPWGCSRQSERQKASGWRKSRPRARRCSSRASQSCLQGGAGSAAVLVRPCLLSRRCRRQGGGAGVGQMCKRQGRHAARRSRTAGRAQQAEQRNICLW